MENTFRSNCCIVDVHLIPKSINTLWWFFFLFIFPSSSPYSQIPLRLLSRGGIPGTRRRWSTSTLPSGCPSPVWGKLCPLSPSSPARRWWRLLWLHPDHLRRLRSLASHWEPSLPERNRREENSLKGSCCYSHITAFTNDCFFDLDRASSLNECSLASVKRAVPERQHAHLDCLPVVDFDNVEVETVHSFPRSHEDAGCWIKMTANVHQDLETQANSAPFGSFRNLHSQFSSLLFI